jgi:gliding motility-associated-like protein
MNRTLLFFTLILFFVDAFATHYRAGEIYYENISYLRYRATVVTYTTLNSPADRPQIALVWGDGDTDTVARANGTLGLDGIPIGETVGNNIQKNVYVSDVHTYPGPSPFYIISINDPNRINNIVNINFGRSDQTQFYVEDTLRIFDPTFFGFNSSPILLNPPIDFANVNQTFYHNPAAFDPDGDSLTYELISPLVIRGQDVPNYVFPDDVSPGIDNDFSINRFTGEIIWETPKQPIGVYNVAILVREYRNNVLIGTVLRDMQIFVEEQNNNPPTIEKINDTCIVAGSLLRFPVIATDPDPLQRITLNAYGGPLELNADPAIFNSVSGIGIVTGLFEWQTVCNHIRQAFYQIVFKAEDNYVAPNLNSIPLSYLETWNIKIVAPAPQNLTATAIGNNINLAWNSPYNCNEIATQKFIGFSIWRREGSNPFVIDTCTPGLAGRGYTKIAENITDYFYADSTAQKGKQYCYRILAVFAERTPFGLQYNKVESLASNEACSELKRDVPLIVNVDVLETNNANGKILVRWLKPLANALNLDTIQFPAPYRYDLKRASGFNINNSPTVIASYTGLTFSLLTDTVYTDTLLNTLDSAYTYEVDFYSNGGNVLVGSSEPASSVFVSLQIGDNRMVVSWADSVPWVNNNFVVFRKDFNSNQFDSIGITSQRNYTDVGLINDSTYCYYVKSIGAYSAPSISSLKLLNNSQEACAAPSDTAAPCPPLLSVTNDCKTLQDKETCAVDDEESFINRLSWKRSTDICDDDVEYYKVYYRSPFDSLYTAIDSTSDTSYVHVLDSSLAGCYFIGAVDSSDNESVPNAEVCIDNCPCYILPNVFTPNGDGKNDLYTPRLPYRFVDKVDMKIYNRWGNLVFETANPNINWNGTEQSTKKEVKEGVYFYVCTVFEIRVDGVKQASDIRNGFIHVIR